MEIAGGMGVTGRNGSPPFDDLGPYRRYSSRRGKGDMVGEMLPLKVLGALNGVSVGKGCGR